MKEQVEYVINKIENSKLETYPYPYLEIENIFQEDFYSEILKNIPQNRGLYKQLSKKYHNRYVLELGFGENINAAIPNLKLDNQTQNVFWKEFQKHFILNNGLSACVKQKYRDYIDERRAQVGKINCRLSRDEDGYSIGVHRDRKDKLFSVLFYLPEKDEEHLRINCGTEILIPKGSFEHDDKHYDYNPDGSHDLFDIYRTVEFLPNKMFSWCVVQNSYHGVSPIKIDGYRDSLAYFLKSKG